jgi:hypothetical protein
MNDKGSMNSVFLIWFRDQVFVDLFLEPKCSIGLFQKNEIHCQILVLRNEQYDQSIFLASITEFR